MTMQSSSANKKLFLSAVSSEFESYRQLLAGDLKRPALDVAVQEDFLVSGGSTLQNSTTTSRLATGGEGLDVVFGVRRLDAAFPYFLDFLMFCRPLRGLPSFIVSDPSAEALGYYKTSATRMNTKRRRAGALQIAGKMPALPAAAFQKWIDFVLTRHLISQRIN